MVAFHRRVARGSATEMLRLSSNRQSLNLKMLPDAAQHKSDAPATSDRATDAINSTETARFHHSHRQHCRIAATCRPSREHSGCAELAPCCGEQGERCGSGSPVSWRSAKDSKTLVGKRVAIWTSSFGGYGKMATMIFERQSFWLWRLT
jgi:hypothetical protein